MEALEDKIKKFLNLNSGSGYGSGLKSLNRERIYKIDGVPTLIRNVHTNYALGMIVNEDLTLTLTYIARDGNYFAHGATLRKAVASAQDKAMMDEPEGKRIARFKATFPDFNMKIPAMELFRWHHILTGSCEQGRRAFAYDKNINLESDYFSVNEFILLTKDYYGGEIIKRLVG